MKSCRLTLAATFVLMVLFAVGWVASDAQAAVLYTHSDASKIRVGVKRLEPFVFISEDGQLSGFSIDLWEAIAADLGIQYEWVIVETVNELIESVQSGQTDAAIAGISLTPQRESMVDFTYPYFESGLKIMVQVTSEASSTSLIDIFFSSVVLKMLGLGMVVIFLMANLIWLMEVRNNPEMPKSYLPGIWDGLWWGLAMMIRHEYLDRAKPNNFMKRLFAMVWMVMGIVLIAEFTATITTSQTVSQLRPSIESLADLQGKRTVTVAGSTSEEFLIEQDIRHDTVEQIDEAYDALLSEQAEAIVFDSPVLLYYAEHTGYGRVKVVGPVFQEEDYSIALPTGSPLRKPINAALLRLKSTGRYDKIYEKWFGSTQ